MSRFIRILCFMPPLSALAAGEDEIPDLGLERRFENNPTPMTSPRQIPANRLYSPLNRVPGFSVDWF